MAKKSRSARFDMGFIDFDKDDDEEEISSSNHASTSTTANSSSSSNNNSNINNNNNKNANAPPNGMCQVCTVVPFQFHHFGAFVCNRCRAFFRRTVRRSRKGGTVFPCITTKSFVENNFPICDITLFRGACQACRYVKCLNVGMIPDSVLTDAARVKKYARDRVRNEDHEDEDNADDDNQEDLLEEEQCAVEESPKGNDPKKKKKTTGKKGAKKTKTKVERTKKEKQNPTSKSKKAQVIVPSSAKAVGGSNPLFQMKILDSELNPTPKEVPSEIVFEIPLTVANHPAAAGDRFNSSTISTIEELKSVKYPFVGQPTNFYYNKPLLRPPWWYVEPQEDNKNSNNTFTFTQEPTSDTVSLEVPCISIQNHVTNSQEINKFFKEFLQDNPEVMGMEEESQNDFNNVSTSSFNEFNNVNTTISLGVCDNNGFSMAEPLDMPDIFANA